MGSTPLRGYAQMLYRLDNTEQYGSGWLMAKQARKADIKIRLTEPLRLQIEKAAKGHGVSMNAEMIERLTRSFHRDEAEDAIRTLMREADEAMRGGKEAALRAWGFQPVGGRPGLWVETDKIAPQEMVALNPALEALIEKVVLRTLERAKS